MDGNIDWKKYLIVLLITAGLFFTAIYLSNYFGSQKINELKTIQDNIAINILSSETQFSLLQESSCKNVSGSVLSGELDDLGRKLEWEENNSGNIEEVSYLKKYYSLLQIKDYILMKKIAASCNVKSAFILYFYTTAENCSECQRESLVLTSLRDKYPELRVYSFDYSTDLSAVRAMLQIYKIKDTELPALVLGDDLLTGFHSIEELDSLVKESFKLQETIPAAKPPSVNNKTGSQ
jgi:hypothetical protein